MKTKGFAQLLGLLVLSAIACRAVTGLPQANPNVSATPTSLPSMPVESGAANPNEPVFITGEITYTSPFFLSSTAEPFVMLEDEAGFVHRDINFQFSLESQDIGPVIPDGNNRLKYELSLPEVPQGTYVDVDNNGKKDTGVQVFAIAYWSNTWGGPFLEKRDGTGWSNAYASTLTDPDRNYEYTGGTLVVWAPDNHQGFPTGFGPDHKLFTADDPTAPIQAGYTIVDLNHEPFRFYKEAQPRIDLNEGVGAVSDFSNLGYSEAFEAMFQKASREYPFTAEKKIDWQALHDKFAPEVQKAKNSADYFRAIQAFAQSIPDEHVGLGPINRDVFVAEVGGGFGLVLAQLSDQRVIASQVLPDLPAAKAGIQPGAEIVSWDQQPITQTLSSVVPYILGPASSPHVQRKNQLAYLTHAPKGTQREITYKNPGDSSSKQVTLQAVAETTTIIKAITRFSPAKLSLPVDAQVLPDSGLGYMRITTFSDDDNLEAHLWDRFINQLIDGKVPGLIIDLRTNGGGNSRLTEDFAGYFFDKEVPLYREYYYTQASGKFEASLNDERITPGPSQYTGPIAVLVGPDCVSACEGFAYALKQNGRSIIVGHTPSAGGFGEVGRGQYKLPGDISMQIPTGRPVDQNGKIPIEGVGVTPDIVVPVTMDSAMGKVDAVLNAAVQALKDKIR